MKRTATERGHAYLQREEKGEKRGIRSLAANLRSVSFYKNDVRQRARSYIH